jgi:hypothetical protein
LVEKYGPTVLAIWIIPSDVVLQPEGMHW